MTAKSHASNIRRFRLHGLVQGLGVRPAIARLARSLGLRGSVANSRHGVELWIAGDEDSVEQFTRQVVANLPNGAENAHIERLDLPPSFDRRAAEFLSDPFAIRAGEKADEPLSTVIPPDRAICRRCLAELFTPTNRRFEYPWISCAECGPRFSMLHAIPYERVHTAMRAFPLCPACQSEFTDADDRRYHAEGISCANCGPRIWFTSVPSCVEFEGREAIERASDVLRQGGIVAVRGLAGYQWLGDATNAQTVARLRQAKLRPSKPFAVMVADAVAATSLAACSAAELTQLESAANPIVIVAVHSQTSLAPNLAPDLGTLGVMLPTTGLHALLLRRLKRPLICTSVNRDGEPLEFDVQRCESAVQNLTDAWLHHDREIVCALDDSVVQCVANKPMVLRLARGFAPRSLTTDASPACLAVGGHQKVTCVVHNGSSGYLGPYLGDLDGLAMRHRYTEVVQHLLRLASCAPTQIVHDRHPEYFTTHWALDQNIPQRSVPHHAAHALAAMWEYGLLGESVLAITWDGAGWGDDETIWGGEFLRLDDDLSTIERWASWRPLPLWGGDRAAREPWRVAFALLAEALSPVDLDELRPFIEQTTLRPSLAQGLKALALAPRTTSVGRLFDGVAALLLGVRDSTYEGEAAIRLESRADRRNHAPLPFAIDKSADGRLEIDWRPLMRKLYEAFRGGADVAELSERFHQTLAQVIGWAARENPARTIVLSGGVFQNRRLVEAVDACLGDAVRWHVARQIPPNDAGIAVGQWAFALQQAKHANADRGLCTECRLR